MFSVTIRLAPELLICDPPIAPELEANEVQLVDLHSTRQ